MNLLYNPDLDAYEDCDVAEYVPPITFGPLPTKKCSKAPKLRHRYAAQQEVTQERNLDMDTNKDQAQKYIRSEALVAFEKGNSKLRNKFYINDDEGPRDAKELVARITAGKYKLADYLSDKDYELPEYGYPLDGLIWRTHKADYDGYNLANKELDLQLRTVKDATIVLDQAVALDTLNGFRAYVDAL